MSSKMTKRPPSKVTQAVAFMKEKVREAGGQRKLVYGDRKVIIEAAAKEFGLSVPTCHSEYYKQVRRKAA